MNSSYRFLIIFSFLLPCAFAIAQNKTKTFKDKDGIYEIQLPASWKSVKARLTTQFTVEDTEQRKRQLTLEKIRLWDENTSLTTEKIALKLDENLKADKQKKLLDSKFVTIDGMKWFYIYYTSNGFRFKSYNIVYNIVRYSFYYIAPENDYLAGESDASACIESFRFLNKSTTTENNPVAGTEVKQTASPAGVKQTHAEKPSVQQEKPITVVSEKKPVAKTGSELSEAVPKEKFICDTAHKPYKYYSFIWEGTPTPKNKNGISVFRKLPTGVKLKAISFINNEQFDVITGVSRHIDDEGMSFDYTNVSGFPVALDERHFKGNNEGLFAISINTPLQFSVINTIADYDSKLREKFSRQIKEMVNSSAFKKAHTIKSEYYQGEFNKNVSKSIRSVEKGSIPGLDCYFISLEEDGALFISVNDKIYFLLMNIVGSTYKSYFYKLNNNYFLLISKSTGAGNSGVLDIYEIRDTGIKPEWSRNTNIEMSNFVDAAEEIEEAKKMKYVHYK